MTKLAYSDLLGGGIRLGSRAPELFNEVVTIGESAHRIYTIVNESFSEPIVEVTQEEVELEAKLGEVMAPGGSLPLMDFTKLRRAYQILKASGMLEPLMAILLKQIGGAALGS